MTARSWAVVMVFALMFGLTANVLNSQSANATVLRSGNAQIKHMSNDPGFTTGMKVYCSTALGDGYARLDLGESTRNKLVLTSQGYQWCGGFYIAEIQPGAEWWCRPWSSSGPTQLYWTAGTRYWNYSSDLECEVKQA